MTETLQQFDQKYRKNPFNIFSNGSVQKNPKNLEPK